MKKRAISIIVATIMVLTLCTPAFANNAEVTSAKTAYVSNINDYGTNLNTDKEDGNRYVVADTQLMIEKSTSNALTVTFEVGGEEVTVLATPVAANESGTTVFFEAESSNPNYEVVYVAYSSNAARASLYFEEYQSTHSNSGKVFNIYLRDKDSETKDYIFLEAFGYDPNYSVEFVNCLPVDAVLGTWGVTQFKPTESTIDDSRDLVSPTAYNYPLYRTYTRTFTYMGVSQTHTIKLKFLCTYRNIPINGNEEQDYRISVEEKTITAPSAPDLNSSTQSFLQVRDVSLSLGAPRNFAFDALEVDGEVYKLNNLLDIIDVSFGVAWENLGASISISDILNEVFTGSPATDINPYRTTFANYPNYAKTVRSELDSSMYLSAVGNYFHVTATIGDYANKASSGCISGLWEYNIGSDVTNSLDYTLTQDVQISAQ